LQERLAVSTGWLNARTVLPLVLTLFLLPRLGARLVIAVLVIVPLAIVAWQLVPNYLLLMQVNALAERLQGP
jgi:hypothetical protein